MDGQVKFWDSFAYAVGVDPGLVKTGLVVLNEYGIISAAGYRSDSKDAMGKRLVDVTDSLIFKTWGLCMPSANKTLFALEMNHMTAGRSAQSALKQRELIGCLRAAAWKNGLADAAFYEVAPTSGKKALTGRGTATKDQMVEKFMEYPGAPLGMAKSTKEACADALGAALAGIAKWEKENSE